MKWFMRIVPFFVIFLWTRLQCQINGTHLDGVTKVQNYMALARKSQVKITKDFIVSTRMGFH